MEKFEIKNFEDFTTCFFCGSLDMYYLSNDQSLEKEAEHVETVMTLFYDVSQHISNEEFQDDIIHFDLETFMKDLFSDTKKHKNSADKYCQNIAGTEEKIVLGACMKFIISIFPSPSPKQMEYLDSFISWYGLLEFNSEIDFLYKTIKNDNNQDILEDW